ncbi:MAG TPA: hypothetical protein VHK69_12550 [Chitinophagaceae bacterium]|jgi:hypothetical protein|nr:hypothetical protein [Chitinophagaceae bacterium]
MKKLFFSSLLLAFSAVLQAQTSGAVVTTVPSSFTAEDAVKIIVDVSKVPNLKGKSPLYIWTWNPGDPAPGNGSWNASSEERRMVQEGPDLWSWTMTPTEYYGKAPSEITQISFLVKAKNGDGDAKSDDINLTVAPLKFVPGVFRVFPKIIGQNEVVTVYLDQNLATDLNTQRMAPAQAKITLLNMSGDVIDAEKTVNLVPQGGKVFAHTFFPPKLFTIPAGVKVSSMRVVFRGQGRDVNGNPVTLESNAFTYGFDELQ